MNACDITIFDLEQKFSTSFELIHLQLLYTFTKSASEGRFTSDDITLNVHMFNHISLH